MKTKHTILAGFAATLITGSASAALLVEETFNYTPGGDSAVEGAGYTTPLGNTQIVDGASDVFTGDVSPFGYSDNSLRIGSGNTAVMGLTTAKGTEYFFSYTFEYASGTTQSRVQFNGTSDQNFFIGTSSGNFGVGSNATTSSAQQTAVSADTEYFVYGSILVDTDNQWTVNANITTDVSSLPDAGSVVWAHTHTQNFGEKGLVDEFTFQSQGGNSYFENLRVDTTYSAIIPEPGTFALFAMAGLALLIGIRRRQ